MENKINFDLISPKKSIFSSEVDMVVVPGVEGDFGVLPEHCPLISELRPGEIEIFNNDKKWIKTLYGDATISKWAKQFLAVNPEQNELRNKWGNFEEEKRFWQPTSILSLIHI